MKIRNQLVTSRDRTWPGTNARTGITVHETANRSRGANAAAHANLQSNGNVRQASWHWQVDDREAVRSFPETVQCWHAGWAARDDIAIEICVNADGNYDQALANAAALIRRLRAEHGIPASRVRQHHTHTGKNCPTILRSRGSSAWAAFVASTDPMGVSPTTPTTGRTWLDMASEQDVKRVVDGAVENLHRALVADFARNGRLTNNIWTSSHPTQMTSTDFRGFLVSTYRKLVEVEAAQAGLVGAIAALGTGEEFDEAKLLAGVRRAAQEGVATAIDSIETTVNIARED